MPVSPPSNDVNPSPFHGAAGGFGNNGPSKSYKFMYIIKMTLNLPMI